MPDVVVAQVDTRAVVGGRSVRIRARCSTAHADAQVVRDHPDWWVPFLVDFPVEDATAVDASVPSMAAAPPAPSPKAVRAWARAEGLEAPARGPLPDDLVDRYLAAQG
jgi:hypothetical protein